MKLAIVGASGQTGQQITREALGRGHDVLALARSPQKIDQQDPRLEIRPADVFDPPSLQTGLAGADAIITSVGKTDLRDKRSDFNTKSHQNVLDAAIANEVRRLIVISSFGAARNVKRKGIRRNIYLFLRRKYYDEMQQMESLVLGSSLNTTVVRAPMLHNRPPRNDWLLTNDGSLPAGLAISRSDLAHYLLDEVENSENISRIVAIADEGDKAPSFSEIRPRSS